MKCEIILEDGTRSVFNLNDAQVRKLKLEASKVRSAHWMIHGNCVDYGLGDEMARAIRRYVDKLPDPKTVETPGAATPGESSSN